MSKSALIIIDMQQGSFTSETPRYDDKGVINRINRLANLFRSLNGKVIYVQHDGTGSGTFEKGNWDWQILKELKIESTDYLLDKYVNDIFYRSNLLKYLGSAAIEELYITGCATDFCVASTVQSALTKDYKITVISDAHTTADRPKLKAKQVIDHYNWVWENMIPTKGEVKVKACNEIVNTFNEIV
ncbi:isochorismatase family protein [Aquimarina sp. ERC-38]|uniref:isochorismatase family protein n=1 Tax=Aquimarina sp. ERC-38 TaxID=2949996 RepID=UPI0022475626|nr:isochorismatase family protein [Aquimarina sp. ERC-38]UZO81023.1 isochorismatase family protein [Aquimarina sp. ERC-38]